MKNNLFKKKYDYDKVLELRSKGYSYSKIEKELSMCVGTAAGIINPKKKKPKKEMSTTSYDFDKVIKLLKNKRNNNEIHKELRPDVDITNFYKWKETLSNLQKIELKKYTKICTKGKLKDPKIKRQFKYVDTDVLTLLPAGFNVSF